MTGPLDPIWEATVGGAVPHASWLVREGDGVLASRDPGRTFSSASMIKTFLLAAALAAVGDREQDLDRPVAVGPERRGGGDGILGALTLPLDLPLRDALLLMIAISDNTATNVVLDALGGLDAANARIAALGFGARVRRYVGGAGPSSAAAEEAAADPALPSPAGIGTCSAAEHDALVAGLLDGRLLGPQLSEQAVDLLARQQDRSMLARAIGERVRFAHKTGCVDGLRHDGGVLLAAGRELHVTCLTDGGPGEEWPDHPATTAMGTAMAWTAQALGIETEAPPGTPALPDSLRP